MTVKEWKRFDKITNDRIDGNYLTAQEILLQKYKIILTDHKSRHDGKFVKVPLKEKLKSGLKNLPGKINQKNFDKGMKSFDKGMVEFSKEMYALSKGLGGGNSKSKPKIWNKKTKSIPIQGKKKNNVKIWADKPVQKRKRKRKSKSEKWDQHEKNLEKNWGKKK